MQNIIIAVLMMGLFGIFLFSITTSFIVDNSNGTITEADLVDLGEELSHQRFATSVQKLNNMTSEMIETGKLAPGGAESATGSESGQAEDSIIKAGYSFIANLGNWVFVYPKGLIEAMIGFFGLPSEFTGVAIAILVAAVAIILISSILKNRL